MNTKEQYTCHVIRSGSWIDSGSWAGSAQRYRSTPDSRDIYFGFRVVQPSVLSASRVLRGGSWFNGPGSLRSANRFRYTPDNRNGFVGFRLTHLSEKSQ